VDFPEEVAALEVEEAVDPGKGGYMILLATF
jgi:hypothetical protein